MMYRTLHEEARAVKEAFKAAGVVAHVGHGTGRERRWLRVEGILAPGCDSRALTDRILGIIRTVTGRTGERSCCVSISFRRSDKTEMKGE
jgi:hypothetical protein